MGLFLVQSSSTEYSQAAMSCYATMAQQLAEAATDEAFLAIEKELKGAKMGPLLKQGETATLKGITGLNPRLLDILPDYKVAAAQTTGLIITHFSRPAIEVVSILPTITDFRPIDHGWFTVDECIYRPKDRQYAFDRDNKGRDYLLSIGFSTKVAVKLGSRKHVFQYQLTRDMKVINVAPIARAYSMFSCLGIDLRQQDDIYNDLNRGKGRLILWNIPFQSRVYFHGPAVIGVENPDRFEPGDEDGAYVINKPSVFPGFNQAFQYDDTYAGISYVPYPGRALWQKRSIFGGTHKNDLGKMTADEQRMFKHNTYVNKGFLPRYQSRWSDLSDYFNFGKEFVRGTYRKQVFLPAGPYCRTPWRFVGERPANWNNQTADGWPHPSGDLKLEHRFVPGDNNVSDNSKIYTELKRHRLYQALTFASTQKFGGYPQTVNPEFSLTFGNPHDAEGILDGFLILTENVFKTFWETVVVVPRMLFIGGEALVRLIVPRKDPTLAAGVDYTQVKNFFPNNFKNFPKAAVVKLRDVSQIPKDDQGFWILDGLYWLDTFQTTGPVVYKGKGVIFVGDYVPARPFTIGGNILRYRDPATKSPGDNHLTLVYYPFPGDGRLPDDPGFLNECQAIVQGKGVTIEASFFSFAGIRCGSTDVTNNDGCFSEMDFTTYGMNPNAPTADWNVNFKGIYDNAISICGNYVNYFVKKHRMNSDVWVFHDNTNPFYYDKATNRMKEEYTDADEIMAHTAHLSPKIQHLAFSGGGGE
jgi:hypothetical protein